MEPRELAFFAAAAQGELSGVAGNALVHRVVTDSREVRRGDLFVAIPGERFDGHAFAKEAVARGAVAAVVEAGRGLEALPRVEVEDPRRALGRMAAAYRAGFRVPVVAVGGSNGKTTTKELIGSVLGGCFETLRSPESFNNDIGVPATLLNLEGRHLAAVVEVGTNHPGELAPLVRMVQPRVGVVTHIGEEHLEFFGSLAGVLEEEGWLPDLLPPDGVLVLPGDFDWSRVLAGRTRARVIRVGEGDRCDWRVDSRRSDATGTTFRVTGVRAEACGEYRVNLLGRHQVGNALLAIAVAAEFGLEHEAIARGLAVAQPARWRMNRWSWDGVEVIEDCYNANLDSTLAALETLREFPCPGRRVVVLGGMAELGMHTARAHQEVGCRAALLGIDRLVGIGDAAGLSVEAAADAGLLQAVCVDSLETAAAQLRAWLRPGDCLLVKGSRSARLERLGSLLRGDRGLRHAA